MKIKPVFMLAVLVFFAMSGCTRYLGLKPVLPERGSVIDTLQPTFQWEQQPEDGITYDLVVYAEGNDINPVYYREGLTGTSHRIESVLEPETSYSWSVRTRKGDRLSEWTKQETSVFTGISYHRRLKRMTFTTPKQ